MRLFDDGKCWKKVRRRANTEPRLSGVMESFCDVILCPFAEIIHVTGKIVEKENGEPLIAVSVCNTYSNLPDSLLTVTDLDGNFEVDVQEGQLLKFNYISFADTIVSESWWQLSGTIKLIVIVCISERYRLWYAAKVR